jgi:RimJ/RimL family protein N-acetyltransferase
MNADPVVMEHFPSLLDRQESDALVERIEASIDARGFGFWAVEVRDGPPFIGFVGLSVPRMDAHFMPAVEVGWRLAAEHWGRGYATEAARAAVEFGFGELELDQIVAFTIPANLRSRRVMERLGMTHDPADDFDDVRLPEGHPMRRLVLYRLDAPGR